MVKFDIFSNGDYLGTFYADCEANAFMRFVKVQGFATIDEAAQWRELTTLEYIQSIDVIEME